jgi:hypothetical protein
MGLRSDHVTGTSYARLGCTPVVRATGQCFGCNMISAITNRGALAFMVPQGKFQNPVFIEFMKRLLRLPGHRPELNPDELLNQDVKTNAVGKGWPTNRAEMIVAVRSHLHRRQGQPQVIRIPFLETLVRYAA